MLTVFSVSVATASALLALWCIGGLAQLLARKGALIIWTSFLEASQRRLQVSRAIHRLGRMALSLPLVSILAFELLKGRIDFGPTVVATVLIMCLRTTLLFDSTNLPALVDGWMRQNAIPRTGEQGRTNTARHLLDRAAAHDPGLALLILRRDIWSSAAVVLVLAWKTSTHGNSIIVQTLAATTISAALLGLAIARNLGRHRRTRSTRPAECPSGFEARKVRMRPEPMFAFGVLGMSVVFHLLPWQHLAVLIPYLTTAVVAITLALHLRIDWICVRQPEAFAKADQGRALFELFLISGKQSAQDVGANRGHGALYHLLRFLALKPSSGRTPVVPDFLPSLMRIDVAAALVLLF